MTRPGRGKTNGETVQKARELRTRLTEAEAVLWKALRHCRLEGIKFRRQHPFGPYVLDFFCVKAQLAVELDGGIHAGADQKEYDRARTEYLGEKGLRVLRFGNEAVMEDLEGVMRKIVEATSPILQLLPSPEAVQEREGRVG